MKQIPEFPNYAITKDGKVWSYKSWQFLKSQLTGELGRGYETVILYKNKKRYSKKVHRLVLEVFVGLCPDNMESCHNNGDRLDNRLENLRWDTRKNNHRDAIRHGTHTCLTQKGENHSQAKLTRDDIEGIIELYDCGLYTQQELADIYNIDQSVISRIVNKRRWKHIWSK